MNQKDRDDAKDKMKRIREVYGSESKLKTLWRFLKRDNYTNLKWVITTIVVVAIGVISYLKKH